VINDGYIKYRAYRNDADIPDIPGLDELNRCRTALFDLGLIGVYPSGIGYGNVSLRVGADRFVISGSATGRERVLSSRHYALVESFDLAENSVRSTGRIDASSESMSHGAVYRAHPGVRCVIHAHSRRLFDRLRAERVPETDPAIPFGTPELALAIEKLVRAGGTARGILVTAGHDEGLIVYGESVRTAQALLTEVNKKGTEP